MDVVVLAVSGQSSTVGHRAWNGRCDALGMDVVFADLVVLQSS